MDVERTKRPKGARQKALGLATGFGYVCAALGDATKFNDWKVKTVRDRVICCGGGKQKNAVKY